MRPGGRGAWARRAERAPRTILRFRAEASRLRGWIGSGRIDSGQDVVHDACASAAVEGRAQRQELEQHEPESVHVAAFLGGAVDLVIEYIGQRDLRKAVILGAKANNREPLI